MLYVVARWVRTRTTTDEHQEQENIRYLIRSANTGAAGELGTRSDLVVKRYYFAKTDTESGPADPLDFYDEFFVDLADTESKHTWQNSIHVATPRGLDRMMVEEQWDSVIGGELLIVRRYNLQTILNAAIEHLQEIYEVKVQIMGARGAQPPERV